MVNQAGYNIRHHGLLSTVDHVTVCTLKDPAESHHMIFEQDKHVT